VDDPRPDVAVVELDAQGRRVVARRHHELVGRDGVFVVAAPAELLATLQRAVRQVAAAVQAGRERLIDETIATLVAAIEVPAPAVLEHARQEARLRERIFKDFGAIRASKRSQSAARWRRQGRVFAVRHGGYSWYLGFQFDDAGRPVPVVADVLRVLDGWSPWQLARWFVGANPWLERRRPADVLGAEPDGVLRAARLAARDRSGSGVAVRG